MPDNRRHIPVTLLKAIRNKQEIAGIHTAMQRDGVALVKFLKWLEDAVPTGRETEISIDKKLHAFRAAQPLYMGESFDTIAGYKEHGAIVHYEATPETDVTLKAEGFLLLDSGAQYLDGTTDITRTIALGNLTEEEKTDYTLILKGHIALATAVFPCRKSSHPPARDDPSCCGGKRSRWIIRSWPRICINTSFVDGAPNVRLRWGRDLYASPTEKTKENEKEN